jgi:beta-carotene hydroxylase
MMLVVGAVMAVFVMRAPLCLQWHAAAMLMGECFTGFFAVWSVHHGCDEHTVARTQRGWLKNFVSYSMFYHLEHHLFPAVPTSHLPELARRLDRVAPHAAQRQVI